MHNPDNDFTWERNAEIGKTSPGSAWFNDYNNPILGKTDDLITPNFRYQDVDSVFLYFNLAAAVYSHPQTSQNIDTLTIMVTQDCGESFHVVYKKWGTALQTANNSGEPVITEFFPTASQWRRDSVDLGQVLGKTEEHFEVHFRISSNSENNIFIDDVVIQTEVVPESVKEKGYLIFPIPAKGEVYIWHYQEPVALRSVVMFNSAGQRVWLQHYNNNASKIINVNLHQLSAGLYFIKMMYTDGSSITERILKY